MANKYIIFPGMGALTVSDGSKVATPIQSAFTEGDKLTVVLADNTERVFTPTSVSEERKTGRIIFSVDNVNYRIRELSEDDGYWMSKYKTFLPVTALRSIIKTKSKEQDVENTINAEMAETMTAYATDDSVYIVGLVYANENGRWSRIGGDWMMMAEGSNPFMDLISIEIDQNRADEFIKIYDENYVTVTDAETYEEPTAETE